MQLLEHFKELTIHPKNAKELKELILQLAIQGKLTQKWREQNPKVEPASVLLEKIKEEKAQLIKDKKIKKEKALPEITEDVKIFDYPESWLTTRLGEVGDWGAGATPLRSRSDFYGGDINWFKSGELNDGIIDYESVEKINDLAIKNSSLRLNKAGDVLIAMYGATIGKTGLLAVDGATNQAVCACTVFSCISNSYLHLLLKALKQVFTNQGEGGAQPNISRVKIRNQVFALPPLEEQKTIVSTVNQLFKEVEALEKQTQARVQLKEDFVTSALRQLTEATGTTASGVQNQNGTSQQWDFLKPHFKTFFTSKEAVKKLRETILQLAVQGKLTTHWRTQNTEVEPASLLLEKIKAEKAQLIKDKKIKKEKPLPEITAEEIPYELPDGWVWCRMQEIGLFERGKSKHRPRNDFRLFEDGKYPLVQTGDVAGAKKTGGIITTHKSAYNEFGLEQSRMWNKGTLCITIAANIAETGTLGFDACFPDSVVGFSELLRGNSAKYVECFITIMKSDLERFAPSTAQKNINLGILYELKFPLPPLEEQKAIVAKVNSLMALCEQLEQEIAQNTQQVEDLMQSCLREVVR